MKTFKNIVLSVFISMIILHLIQGCGTTKNAPNTSNITTTDTSGTGHGPTKIINKKITTTDTSSTGGGPH